MTKKLRRNGATDVQEETIAADLRASSVTAEAAPTPASIKPSFPPPPLPVQRKPPAERPAWPTTPASRVVGFPKSEPPVSDTDAAAETGNKSQETVAAEEQSNADAPVTMTPPPVSPLPSLFPGFQTTPNGNGFILPTSAETASQTNGATRSPEISGANSPGTAPSVEMRAARPSSVGVTADSRLLHDLETQISNLVVTQRRLVSAMPWLGFGVVLSLLLSGGALYRAQTAVAPPAEVSSSVTPPLPRMTAAPKKLPAQNLKKKPDTTLLLGPGLFTKPVGAEPDAELTAPKASPVAPVVSKASPVAPTNDDASNFVLNANALGQGFRPAAPPKKH